MRGSRTKRRGFFFTTCLLSAAIAIFFPMSILPASAAPAIELSPDRGPTGSAVNIEGSGFVALSTVTLTFDKRSLPTVPETIVVDALGKFEAAFEVPDSADEGENLVVATAEIVLDNDEDGEEHDDENDDEKRDRGDKKRDRDDRDDDQKDKEEDKNDDEKDDDEEDKDDKDDDKGRDRDDEPKNFLRHRASTTFNVVIEANSAPVAQSLSVATREERSISIILEGSDDDGDQISFSIVDNPQHGELHDLNASSGTVTYHPSPDYRGKDSFSFKVNDGEEDSNTAQVTITVTSSTTHSRSGGSNSDANPYVPDDTSADTDVASTEAIDQPVIGGISQYITDFIKTSQTTSTGTNPFLTIVTGTRIVEATDTQPPRLILPTSPLEVDAISQLGARVSYTASALDDFDGELTPYCSPESGYEFPVGTVNVVCKATDRAGNTALASFVVAVRQDAQEESPSVVLPFLIMGIVGAASFGGFWVMTRARAE